MVKNLDYKKILLVENEQLIPVIESFGFVVTSVQSYSELYDLSIKEKYDLIILTDIGYSTNEIISCALKLRQNNLVVLVFVEVNNSQLISELLNHDIFYKEFPVKKKDLKSCLMIFLYSLFPLLSSDSQFISDSVEDYTRRTNKILSYFDDKKPAPSFWGKIFKKFNVIKKTTYLDKFNSIVNKNPTLKKQKEYFSIMNKDGTTEDIIPSGIGRFGYDFTNPIPTDSILGSNSYLERLRDKNGRTIKYERFGSCSADNIKNLIDSYKILDSNGKLLCIIYISPYQKTISKKAPEGFILK